MRPQPLRRGIPLHFLLNRLRQLGDRRVQVVQQLQQVDSRSATGSLYINRFPSAALTPRIVRSPSFSLRFVPHEVKLPEIAVKILAADIVVNADNPALHKCMAAFGCICVNVATRIFAGAVVHSLVYWKICAETSISRVLIRDHAGPLNDWVGTVGYWGRKRRKNGIPAGLFICLA